MTLEKLNNIWMVVYRNANGWRIESDIYFSKESALERVADFREPGPGKCEAFAIRFEEKERAGIQTITSERKP